MSYRSKDVARLSLKTDKLRHTDMPNSQAMIDYYYAMQTEDFNQNRIAGGVRDTLKLRYSVLHKLYCVKQDHKDFLVQLQFQRPPPQPPTQSPHPHQARQPQHMSSHRDRLDHDIMLELRRDALSRHIGQRLDLLYIIMTTENCLTYARDYDFDRLTIDDQLAQLKVWLTTYKADLAYLHLDLLRQPLGERPKLKGLNTQRRSRHFCVPWAKQTTRVNVCAGCEKKFSNIATNKPISRLK